MPRPKTYTPQTVRVIEGVLRRTRCLRETQRILAKDYDGPWGVDGPSIKKMREIHRSMKDAPELNNEGGRPSTYTDEQKYEMARLASLYGITGASGAMAIIAAKNQSLLSTKRNKKIFPKPVHVSQPTISNAYQSYAA